MKNKLIWIPFLLAGYLMAFPVAAKPEKEATAPEYHSSIQAPKDHEQAEQLQKLVRITEKEAVSAASAKAGAAKHTKVELENEDGNVVYVVEFKDGKQEREIVVDAGNGKILSDKIEKED